MVALFVHELMLTCRRAACQAAIRQYFPPNAVNREYFKESSTHTTCPWKGLASYYTVVVDGEENKDAAWYYPAPKDVAKQIQGYIAFWRGIKVEV